jgi:hypothetical protein
LFFSFSCSSILSGVLAEGAVELLARAALVVLHAALAQHLEDPAQLGRVALLVDRQVAVALVLDGRGRDRLDLGQQPRDEVAHHVDELALGLADEAQVLGRLLLARVDVAREAARADDDAVHAGRHLERVVLHVLARAPKIAWSSFSSGVSSDLLLGLTLPTRMSPGPTLVPTMTTPVSSRRPSDDSETFGDVARELLAAQLGLADLDVEVLDVDRGEDVVADQPLRDDDRVLEVVAVPDHEADEHVAPQRQLSLLGGRAVGDDLAAATFWPGFTIGRWFRQVFSLRPTNLRSV